MQSCFVNKRTRAAVGVDNIMRAKCWKFAEQQTFSLKTRYSSVTSCCVGDSASLVPHSPDKVTEHSQPPRQLQRGCQTGMQRRSGCTLSQAPDEDLLLLGRQTSSIHTELQLRSRNSGCF